MRKSRMAKTPTPPVAKTAAPAAKIPAKAATAAASKPLAKPAPAAAPAKATPPPPAPKPILRTTGLSPKEQRLRALLAKAAHQNSGAKPAPGASAQSFSAKTSFAGKKTSFQRKAV
jgi:hypothetical protein